MLSFICSMAIHGWKGIMQVLNRKLVWISGSGRWGTADSGSLSGRWGSTSTNDQWDEPTGHPHRSSSYRDTTLSLSRSGRLLQDQQQQQQEGESVWSTGLNFLAGRNSAKKSSSFRESSNLGQGRNNIINTMATGTTSTSNSSSSAHHFGGDLGSGAFLSPSHVFDWSSEGHYQIFLFLFLSFFCLF